MNYKIMPKAAFPGWIERLSGRYRVVGPRQKHGQYVFDEIDDVADLALHYPTSVLPPKKYLVPQKEVLLNYQLDGSRLELAIEPPPTVILGLHTCDVHALKLFDRIFSQGFTDQHYQAHRESVTLVSMECLETCSANSFCRDMGTASAADGFDLHMVDLGEAYAFMSGTEKGAALFKGFHHIFDATDKDLAMINEVLQEKWEHFPYRLDFNVQEMPELLHESFNNTMWDELGQKCLACGSCTQVCPTCYCFDVTDEVDLLLAEGQRVRRWDSCQIHEFAMVAGGHNFRERLAARQRHRFMRKGKYQMDAYGMVGCVGCGRCARACLAHIAPIEVFNELYARSQALDEDVVEDWPVSVEVAA
ncbi:MAG: 4Fe-4S dicluster domain-containing protein [Anaerolineales bacterium]|nr:4Fe-4S dicluster domain-containing protein [Anaerolineales bacterium]